MSEIFVPNCTLVPLTGTTGTQWRSISGLPHQFIKETSFKETQSKHVEYE